MSDGVAARRAALALVEAVLDRDRSLDDACADSDLFRALDARDRAFARLTALTVFRRLGQLDDLIGRFVDRPPKGRARRVLTVLRIALAQRFFLNTPVHAAVDAAVRLARAEGLDVMAGLVNAVLRRADREGSDTLATQDAARLNTPRWLWDDWTAQFGETVTRAIAQAHQNEPPTDLTVPTDPDEWANRLNGRRMGAETVRLNRPGDIAALPGYGDGAWWVQDAAAALPARLLGAVAGRRILDLCAAPGGKTAQLISAGAQVTALDRSGPRLARLRENLTRLGMVADIVQADAMQWRPDRPFDAILLDAPCSATGTLRRHPEIAHRRAVRDVAKLAGVQSRLLAAAAEMLAPGGTLVAATCSLQTEEGPGLMAAATGVPGLLPNPIDREEVTFGTIESGALRTHPALAAADGGMDGFFAVRFRKQG